MSAGKNDVSWDFTLEHRRKAEVLLTEYVSSVEMTSCGNSVNHLIIYSEERKRQNRSRMEA